MLFAFFNMCSKAASCSLGMIPSSMASLIELFRLPISRQGCRSNIRIISSPSTGGWKLRIRSFSSRSFSFWRTSSKLSRNFCFRASFFEVMSLRTASSSRQYHLRLQKADVARRNQLLHHLRITMGRMCRLTNFWTYFIFSFMGSFILRKRSGIIFSPISYDYGKSILYVVPSVWYVACYIMQQSGPT